jgi:hypothetical protein
MYLENKYTNWYLSLINKAKNRKIPQTYYEKHHIIPKSLGGSDESDNLVVLTSREHYIAHWLLTKMVSGEHKKKMCLAFFCMNTLNDSNKNSKGYKSSHYWFTRQYLTLENPAKRPEVRQKISESKMGELNPAKRPEVRLKLSNSLMGKSVGSKNPASKKVISPDGIIFDTMKDAANYLKIPRATFQYWLKTNRFGWAFYE